MLTVRVENQTKQSIVCERCQLALSFFRRVKGLLLTSKLGEEEGLLIIPCRGIHTYFMRYSIDVAFLDREAKVLDFRVSVPPFRVFTCSHPQGFMALELKAGRLEETSTEVGDQLSITIREQG